MARYTGFFVTAALAGLLGTPALLAQSRVDAPRNPLPEGAIARLETPGYDGGFPNLVFSADGRTLFYESGKSISIDTTTWQPRAAPGDLLRTRFRYRESVSVDCTLCVVRDGDQRETVFDTRTGGVVARLGPLPRDRGGPGARGFFSPRARVYVMQDCFCDGKEVDTLFAIPSGKRLWQFRFDRGGTYCWSFSADESRVAFLEMRTRMIRVHETATGKLLRQFRAEAREVSLALSQDGNLLAVWAEGLRDVQIHDVRTGKRHRSLTLQEKARERDEACLAWSPDNSLLAVGGLGNSVRIWDVASGRVRSEFRGHPAQASCLAFSPDGRLLASAGQDTTLLVWKVLPDK
jgi:WD40 repeat protein